MSAHVSQPSLQYYGVLNGIMYRIDTDSMSPAGRMVGAVPLALQAPALAQPLRAPTPSAEAIEAAERQAAEALAAERLRAERTAARALLFKRDGSEPLRAGHPDLWALLVAGTCLEGTAYPAR